MANLSTVQFVEGLSKSKCQQPPPKPKDPQISLARVHNVVADCLLLNHSHLRGVKDDGVMTSPSELLSPLL